MQKVEDNQIINGTGTSPQLKGFLPVIANATAAAVGKTLVDAIGIAVFELAAAGYMADGTVVNPADWGTVAMKTNSQGNYLFANPLEYTAVGRIWGTAPGNVIEYCRGQVFHWRVRRPLAAARPG